MKTISDLMFNPLPEGRLDDILLPEADNPVMQQGFVTTNLDTCGTGRAPVRCGP